jgi:hypothetical protein
MYIPNDNSNASQILSSIVGFPPFWKYLRESNSPLNSMNEQNTMIYKNIMLFILVIMEIVG